MALEIRMPKLASSMTEATLVAWRVAPGDRVAAGEVVAEIETDKATAELEAESDAVVLELLVAAGSEAVPVGALLARLGRPGAVGTGAEPGVSVGVNLAPPAPATHVAPPAPAPATHAAPPAPATQVAPVTRPNATPLAQRMAHHAGIALDGLQGSGPSGRIRKADVEALLRERPASPACHGSGATSPASHGTALAPEAGATPPGARAALATRSDPAAEAPWREVPLSRLQRTAARRLAEVAREAPHFQVRVDCRVDALLARRERLRALDPEARISLNDLVIRAAALAARETPEVNATFCGDAVRRFERVDVAVAVATEAGLVTPVLRHADGKGLAAIAREMRDLATRARAGRLAPHELEGGTFGLSNLGMFGVESLDPILNPPQAAILGVGAATRRAVVAGDRLEIGTVLGCTLSCDHRALDGAAAARFLSGLRRRLEDPDAMLL